MTEYHSHSSRLGGGNLFQSNWIVSKRYDLFYFIGSVLASFLILGFHILLAYGFDIEIERNTGIITFTVFSGLFDMPHILQMFSRSHVDQEEHKRHRHRIVYGLILFVLIGELSVFLGYEIIVFNIGLVLGVWHILKQNIGFLKIYKGLNGDRAGFDRFLDEGIYYAVCAAGILGDIDFFEDGGGAWSSLGLADGRAVLGGGAFVIFCLFCVVFISRQLWLIKRKVALNLQKLLFMGATIPIYILLLLEFESVGFAVPLTIFIAVETIYHDVQYQGWIQLYQKRRFPQDPEMPKRWFKRTLYIGLLLALVPIIFRYLKMYGGWSLESLMSIEKKYLIYFSMPVYMLIVYHYYIEGVIWRFRESPELKGILTKS